MHLMCDTKSAREEMVDNTFFPKPEDFMFLLSWFEFSSEMPLMRSHLH